jgi:hypothetical protein
MHASFAHFCKFQYLLATSCVCRLQPKPPPPSDEALNKRVAAQEADRLPASSVAGAASQDTALREATFTDPPSEVQHAGK